MSGPLAIVGPTAAGKSALAVDIARTRGGEIVAVDAFTVYRGLDIGTATPSAADRAAVPHHLVNVLDPWQDVTVAWFQQAARAAIAGIRERGALPLLVGGSGLYFRAVVDDLRFPPTDDAVRARLTDTYADDPAAAHARLADLDPDAAAKIEPGNLRRSVRALEVIELTGERFSSFAAAWDDYTSVYTDLEVVYLEPPTDVLRSRIVARALRMVDDGLLDECRRLRELERPLSRTAAQAIGYAEGFAVLDGTMPADELVTAIADRTWRYARRQRSWFRRDPRCAPADPDTVRARWA